MAKPEPDNDDGDASSKRPALTGQWKTPPAPMFPAGPSSYGSYAPAPSQQQHNPSVPEQNDLPNPTGVPENSEAYEKALQEAYRKGAQAAARLAHQQQQQPDPNIPTAASCPNLQRTNALPQQSHLAPSDGTAAGTKTTIQSEEAAYAAATTAASPAVASTPAPSHSVQFVLPQPVPDPLQSMPQSSPPYAAPVSAQSTHYHAQPLVDVAHMTPHGHQQNVLPVTPQTGRSVSMPDMSAYSTAQAEEEKRQKRLARNRASARLRRLRKKNLVDAYEVEVGVLEKTLKQLRAHEWGASDDHKALLDALGMERGQQTIDPSQRTQVIRDILDQQIEHVNMLRHAQMEQQCLAMMIENPDDELSQELGQVLTLSDAQKQEILVASKGLDKEVEALETIAASLQALKDNEWLVNEGVQKITDQFTSILHKNQLSKFLLWTDANVEAIDQLDYVQVQPLQAAPTFAFGVEAMPMDDEEK